MKKFHLLVILSFILVLNPIREASAKQQLDCKKLAQIFKAGVEDENGICSVEIVRRDLNVTHMGQKMSPETTELAFHFSFEKVDNQTAVMGELALLEEEVNPVITELQKGKLEVTALHNHMIHERPRIMYVHFQGLGDMMQQANTIKKAIEKTGHK